MNWQHEGRGKVVRGVQDGLGAKAWKARVQVLETLGLRRECEGDWTRQS